MTAIDCNAGSGGNPTWAPSCRATRTFSGLLRKSSGTRLDLARICASRHPSSRVDGMMPMPTLPTGPAGRVAGRAVVSRSATIVAPSIDADHHGHATDDFGRHRLAHLAMRQTECARGVPTSLEITVNQIRAIADAAADPWSEFLEKRQRTLPTETEEGPPREL